MINIDRQLIKVFCHIKLQKKEYLDFFFYLRKISQFLGQFSITTLVKKTYYVKYCSVLTQYCKIDLKIAKTFKSKKIYISRFFFFIQFYATKNFQ